MEQSEFPFKKEIEGEKKLEISKGETPTREEDDLLRHRRQSADV